jgi:hypothetical protein
VQLKMTGQCMRENGTRAGDMAGVNGANLMVQSMRENTSSTRCGESVHGGRVTGMFMRAGTRIISGDDSLWELRIKVLNIPSHDASPEYLVLTTTGRDLESIQQLTENAMRVNGRQICRTER